jgi:hypothetical protein
LEVSITSSDSEICSSDVSCLLTKSMNGLFQICRQGFLCLALLFPFAGTASSCLLCPLCMPSFFYPLDPSAF